MELILPLLFALTQASGQLLPVPMMGFASMNPLPSRFMPLMPPPLSPFQSSPLLPIPPPMITPPISTFLTSTPTFGSIPSVAISSNTLSAQSAVDYEAVRSAIKATMDQPGFVDGSFAPLYIRLAWHASGTYSQFDGSGGSDGATMRFSPEKDWGANKGLELARNQLESVKALFPAVSYGDLWTLAGVVAIEHVGGPKITWSPGRRDDIVRPPVPAARLPDPTTGASNIRGVFYRLGFNDREIVALMGAHCLGRKHFEFTGFTGSFSSKPLQFSNLYYKTLISSIWTPKQVGMQIQYENVQGNSMLPTDIALIQDPLFRQYVEFYAKNEEAFRTDFASAFSKLLALGV